MTNITLDQAIPRLDEMLQSSRLNHLQRPMVEDLLQRAQTIQSGLASITTQSPQVTDLIQKLLDTWDQMQAEPANPQITAIY